MTRTGDMKTEPGMLMRRMFNDLDRFFEPREWPFAGWRTPATDFPWIPELEMTERDHQLTVTLDLPGLERKEVSVNVTDKGLIIEGERRRDVENTENDWFTTERSYGRFYRMVPLPKGVIREEVKATFKDGVLTITVPLSAVAATATRTVPVEGEPEKKSVKVAA